MKPLGTILPTRDSLRKADIFADQQAAKRERVANKLPELYDCDRRVVGGEVRYYDATNKYAIIGRDCKVRWFRVTPDGEFAI
jgi:hypothetical protein